MLFRTWQPLLFGVFLAIATSIGQIEISRAHAASNSSFWVEPTRPTTIGVGQNLDVYAVMKPDSSSGSNPFPIYLAPASVKWTSSNPRSATVDSHGSVTGIAPGSTVITAYYENYVSRLSLQISGKMVQRKVRVPGQGVRSYSLYIPVTIDDRRPRPLLLSLHGGGGTAMIQASTSLLNHLAQEQNLYVAYPNGSGAIQTFNGGACCGEAQAKNVDDVEFIKTVLDDVQSNFPIDPSKIYANGFSNGSIMTHRLACALSDRLAGFMTVSGGSGEFDSNLNQYYSCNPARPIPMLEVHAMNDRNYPYYGGQGSGVSGTFFYPIPSTLSDWLQRNNLTDHAVIEQVTSTTTCYHYTRAYNPRKPSARVTFCLLNPPDVYDPSTQIVYGGGHSWPGGVRSPHNGSDVPVTDFDLNTYMWNLFNP